MQERRKGMRRGLESSLTIKRLDGAEDEDITIDIIDVSKSGIGFFSEKTLEIGTIYESHLRIWTQEVLHAFIQITRIDMKEDGFEYGAFFIGMPEMDSARIEVYNTVERTAREMEESSDD